MQHQIKKAPREVTGGAINNNNIVLNRYSLPTIERQPIVIKISEKILIQSPPMNILSKIIETNRFPNPKFEANAKHGHSNWNTVATIETYQKLSDGSILVPVGFLPALIGLCKELNFDTTIDDRRAEIPVVYPSLKGVTLREYQDLAVVESMQSDQGVLVAPTGSGKTLIALELIRRRGQKSLILVHRSELAKQWAAKIKECLGIKVGMIGDGKWEIGNQVTIAMIQTLALHQERTKALSNTFGLIIADECHHTPADQFYSVLSLLAAKYRYGLSATPTRNDCLEKMIELVVGPTIVNVTREEVEGNGSIVPAVVFSVETRFYPGYLSSWSEYIESIASSNERNALILNLAQKSEGAALILVDRVSHAERLSGMLTQRKISHVLAHGKINKKERESVMKRIKSSKITIGTSSLLGEGLDVSVWGTLIMGSPISSEIKLMQAIGRIVRPSPGKEKAIVLDLKDDCGFSGSSFNKRFEIYKKHKIWVNFSKENYRNDNRY